MRIILLSGGAGKRLWPLSNSVRSKQFLKLLPSNLKTDKQISMIQRIWQQLCNANLSENSILATNKLQVEIVQNQLGNNIPLVIEPERRGTYPAIILSSVYLNSIKKSSHDEIVIVMPVDFYVKDDFFEHIKSVSSHLKDSKADIALIGIKPTSISNRYGYIIPKHTAGIKNKYQLVDSFIEKPNEKQVKDLIAKGAFWNSGIFVFKLGFILEHIKQKEYPTDFDEMVQFYNKLANNSFDYEFVEKNNNSIVIPYDGEWKDLGTWKSLTEEISSQILGKGHISVDSENVNIINELECPISVVGGSNIVIAVCSDGILIANKEESEKIKGGCYQCASRPMYDERRWGSYRVLDYFTSQNKKEVLTKKVVIETGKNISYQKHFLREEVWTIVCGTGLVVVEREIWSVNPGDVIKIPIGTLHSIKATTDLEFIEVQMGSKLIEEDIFRLLYEWDKIEKYCMDIEK
ncbi:sugar phosphate nucleotidyltransferase [Bacillus tropicus]|uniref:sugar phosphate nucleotidyltransferase n=1 Tax=Bacillus tropicus TaxID=2026188 RepID=UPI00207A29BC|nr:sugar phosphate nucleotidyltransferase [Bacillus tropicus]USK99420.1 mannose-1-phosphate guanylyltransferase [Bacillus tropicus]